MGPIVVVLLCTGEAKHLHALTDEEAGLISVKLMAAGSEALGRSDPTKSLAHLPASDIARFFERLGDWYLEAQSGKETHDPN